MKEYTMVYINILLYICKEFNLKNTKNKDMKIKRIIYWAVTGLLSAMLIMSSGMYIYQNEMIQQLFTGFGYPTYLIYPLVVLKISAVIVLLTQKNSKIKEWAYAGLFFEFVLAFFAHIMVGDGEQIAVIMALILLMVSYVYNKKINNLQLESV
jgi:cytochrome bd-type quinol oxidase subunit 2